MVRFEMDNGTLCVLYFNEAGLQMFWADAKQARRIRTNMWKHNIKFHQLPYREMEHLRQVWARGRYAEVHGEVITINQSLNFFPFVFTSDHAFPLCCEIKVLK